MIGFIFGVIGGIMMLRLLYLFDKLTKKKGDRAKLLQEIILWSLILFIAPFIAGYFITG